MEKACERTFFSFAVLRRMEASEPTEISQEQYDVLTRSAKDELERETSVIITNFDNSCSKRKTPGLDGKIGHDPNEPIRALLHIGFKTVMNLISTSAKKQMEQSVLNTQRLVCVQNAAAKTLHKKVDNSLAEGMKLRSESRAKECASKYVLTHGWYFTDSVREAALNGVISYETMQYEEHLTKMQVTQTTTLFDIPKLSIEFKTSFSKELKDAIRVIQNLVTNRLRDERKLENAYYELLSTVGNNPAFNQADNNVQQAIVSALSTKQWKDQPKLIGPGTAVFASASFVAEKHWKRFGKSDTVVKTGTTANSEVDCDRSMSPPASQVLLTPQARYAGTPACSQAIPYSPEYAQRGSIEPYGKSPSKRHRREDATDE
jgi:hypothetical protein